MCSDLLSLSHIGSFYGQRLVDNALLMCLSTYHHIVSIWMISSSMVTGVGLRHAWVMVCKPLVHHC